MRTLHLLTLLLTIHTAVGQYSESDSIRHEYFGRLYKSQGWLAMAGSTSAMLIYVGTDNSFQHSNQVQTSDVLAVFGIAYLTNTLVRIVARPFNRKRICRKLGIPKALAKKWEKEQSHGYTYTPIAEYSDGGE